MNTHGVGWQNVVNRFIKLYVRGIHKIVAWWESREFNVTIVLRGLSTSRLTNIGLSFFRDTSISNIGIFNYVSTRQGLFLLRSYTSLHTECKNIKFVFVVNMGIIMENKKMRNVLNLRDSDNRRCQNK